MNSKDYVQIIIKYITYLVKKVSVLYICENVEIIWDLNIVIQLSNLGGMIFFVKYTTWAIPWWGGEGRKYSV